jgi:hypothetical protein
MAKGKIASRGVCVLCKQEFGKGSMTRHLAKCLAEHEPKLGGASKTKAGEILHLTIQGQYLPQYWLHVETAGKSRFEDLDAFLREIWLECCGHMSEFKLPKPKLAKAAYGANPLALMASMFDEDEMMQEIDAIMAAQLGSRVKPGDEFVYEYDFGSTTPLALKVVGKRDGTLKKGEIRLLARNLPPDIRCDCGKPAVFVCTECAYEESGWLCKACSKKHGCGDEMFLPVVNSPRVGVCGYTGTRN